MNIEALLCDKLVQHSCISNAKNNLILAIFA